MVRAQPSRFFYLCEKPGKRGVLPINSAKMHPTDHISTPLVYSEALRMTSGERYHRVTTYLFKNIFLLEVSKNVSYSVLNSFSFSNPLASPKSQIFKSQFLFRRRLLGFRSLCMTLAECI